MACMMGVRESLWTLDELAERVALALSVGYDGQANGQVRDVPNRRTIRYYTTLGLIDRPAAMMGRTALYGRRHLLQLVAIKRLQAEGLSLAELQERLVGLTDGALEQTARLPPLPEETAAAPAPVSERAESFWREPPAEAPADGPALSAPVPLQGIPLAGGATLLVAAARPLDANDIQALREAAAPLLERLEQRGLVPPPERRPS
jgi:DNA-binding transcriptional MerR regulator